MYGFEAEIDAGAGTLTLVFKLTGALLVLVLILVCIAGGAAINEEGALALTIVAPVLVPASVPTLFKVRFAFVGSVAVVGVVRGTGIGDGIEPGAAVGGTVAGPVTSSTSLSLSDDESSSFISMSSISPILPLLFFYL